MKIDFISDINKDLGADLNYPKVDRFILKVLWGHLVVFLLFIIADAIVKLPSIYPSPFGWRVISYNEAFYAFLLAIVITLFPTLLINIIRNRYFWRVIVTFALTIYSYLLVFITGGSIEAHFHFFIIAALLVVYADWRLGWILLVLTGLHHGILNYFEPGWVYFYGRNDFSVISHALPVLVAVIFTTMLCNNNRNGIISLKDSKKSLETRTAELEKLKGSLEHRVGEQTTDLENKVSELQNINKHMIDRELRMAELKKENEELKKKIENSPRQ